MLNQRELEIAEWLQIHKDGLQEKINKTHNPAYHLFPDSLYFIYLENYENNVIDIIKKEIQELQLNPEENLIINKDFVIMVLGKEILIPNK
jgi:hypothetical protein